MNNNKREKISQTHWIIITSVLVFTAVSLLLNLLTTGLENQLDKMHRQDATSSETEPMETREPLDKEEIYEELAEVSSLPDQPTDKPGAGGNSDAATEEPGSSEPLFSGETQLSISADELPSFDFSSQWVSEDGTQAHISTGDYVGTLYLFSGDAAVSLEAAISGKLLECSDFSIPCAVSHTEQNDATSIQAINTVMGELYTDIYIATQGELLQFTINRTDDTDGCLYAEIRSFVRQHFDLTVPESPEPEPNN